MSTHDFKLSICNELIYENLDQLMNDLKSIGGTIEIEDDGNVGYFIKKSSIEKISKATVSVRDRLSRVCSALIFDLPIDVEIDHRTVFINARDTVYVLTNIGTEDDKYNIDYFKQKIAEAISIGEDPDYLIVDYMNAKDIVRVLKEWDEDENSWI